jgi:hypothetical protein
MAFVFREYPVASYFPAGIEHGDPQTLIEQVLRSSDP